jgi:hypothetical protein
MLLVQTIVAKRGGGMADGTFTHATVLCTLEVHAGLCDDSMACPRTTYRGRRAPCSVRVSDKVDLI